MPDYNKSIIYYIHSNEDNLIYIGSTTQKLINRINHHKRGNGISRMILCKEHSWGIVENYPCNTKEELLWRERYWVERCKNTFNLVNLAKPIRTYEEKLKYISDNDIKYRKQRNYNRKIQRRYQKTWGSLLDIDITLFN
jgi:predicted GIY-YIG superfamily endonuclease